MNAIIGASDQRPDECGSSEKRDCSSESTTLDRGPNTFLPAGRRLPEWLKACVREDGSYDEDLATQLAIAEFHDIDHRGPKFREYLKPQDDLNINSLLNKHMITRRAYVRPNKHSPVAECLTTANCRTPGLSARIRYEQTLLLQKLWLINNPPSIGWTLLP